MLSTLLQTETLNDVNAQRVNMKYRFAVCVVIVMWLQRVLISKGKYI